MKRDVNKWMVAVAAACATAALGNVARAEDAAASPPEADKPLVAAMVAKLADADPAKRDAAQWRLEGLASVDVPLVVAAAADPATLPTDKADADARQRLDDVAAYLTPRVAVRRRREAASAELNAYLLKAALRDYDATADRDPKWDALGRQAIEAVCRGPVGIAAGETAALDRRTTVRKALAAGCDAPAFLAQAARYAADAGAVDVGSGRPVTAAKLWIDGYAAANKRRPGPATGFLLAEHVLTGTAGGAYGQEKRADQKLVAGLVKSMSGGFNQVNDVSPAVRLMLCEQTVAALESVNRLNTGHFRFDVKEGTIPALDKMDAASPNDAGALALRGQLLVDWAWEARGAGFAGETTDKQFKGFADRLAEARAVLVKAYAADPDRPGAAAQMVKVMLGTDDSTRPEMEQWYGRAMEADPDDPDAGWTKLQWLLPKWHGTADEALEFARDRAAHGSWTARQPFLLVTAHKELAFASGNGAEYYKDPAVWTDLSGVYDGWLRRHPNDNHERSAYAAIAYVCQQYVKADALFTELGDNADPTVFGRGGPGPMRDAAAKRAKE